MQSNKRNGKVYALQCDICGEGASFNDAVQYKKDEGWKSQKHNGEWEDICPECQ